MCELLASIPSEQPGERFLLGTISNGNRVVIRYTNQGDAGICSSSNLDQEDVHEIFTEIGLISSVNKQGIRAQSDQSRGQLAIILRAADWIGWERVKYLSDDGSTIEFLITDRCDRRHTVRFVLNTTGSSTAITYETKLPEEMLVTTDEATDIVKIYERFIASIEDYQAFWSDMDELDSDAYILEPTKPGYGDKERLVYLDPHVSMRLIVDPLYSRSLPKLQLVGPDSKIRPYQLLMDERLTSWDEERSLTDNLIQIFGPFARPGEATQRSLKRQRPLDTKHDDEPLNCEICYGSDDPPQTTCRKCQRSYHNGCLQEFFKRQGQKRATFGSMTYQCPHCGQAMSMKLSSIR